MKIVTLLLLTILFNTTTILSQNTFISIIKDLDTGEALAGATAVLNGTSKGAIADESGMLEILDIPDGDQIIVFSYIGYADKRIKYNFPLSSKDTSIVFLESSHEELEEVFVSSTRGRRTIENIPSRIEVIAGEELEEKGNMKPGDIRMLLNESTGIQTQQTSATSYNSSIRIQGLDGKYTQILRDGLPLYSGFAGGLSLLQIVPLDLKQVEVIKGASSTLYGGGAIAGLVNLISKVPEEERHIDFLLNGTSASGFDASGFYSQKFSKSGTTIFASYNSGKPYDPADIGFTAIPKFNRFTINPRLFLYFNEKTTLNIGFNNTNEDRIGGDIRFIEGSQDSTDRYFERNKTNRFSTQSGLNIMIKENLNLAFKNSMSFFDRRIEIPGYIFSGNQISSFSEFSVNYSDDRSEWIAGINLWTDQFKEDDDTLLTRIDYNHITPGAFIQNTRNVSDKLSVETGLRGDYQNEYGFFLLPRVSVLYKSNDDLSFRVGGGMGYKIPTVFTEDAERIQFRNVLPIDVSSTKAEKSFGGNFDINYRTLIADRILFTINPLFFYTRVENPLILVPVINTGYEFLQPEGFLDTRGVEINIKLSYQNFKLFTGYTMADVKQHYNGVKSTFPLVARHRLNNVLMYEIEEKLKIGLELYYYSSQKLNDGDYGKPYFITGLMMEKLWDQFSVFLNFENFTDTRQTKFDTIYSGSATNPVFRDIYAPLDGFVINGGIKINL